MRYEGEVRWRFKGDPGLCSRYIPQARTFCGVTVSLQGDGVETYQRRVTLPDKARIEVLKYPAMVPIIEIDVLDVEASEAPKLRGFILRPWENDHVDAISGADKELVLSYRDRTPNSYYTFWPSKDTPEYGQARENYAYLPNFPSGCSKFGNVLWTNGTLSCSIHGPQLRYWLTESITHKSAFTQYYIPESVGENPYRGVVFSCGRQIYDIASTDAVENDLYIYGHIQAAALRKEDDGLWLFMCRSYLNRFVLCSYKVVESASTGDTHTVDCSSVRTHADVAFSATGIRWEPISAWVFNSSCTAVSALFDSVETYSVPQDDIEIRTNNPSRIVTFSGSDGAWTSTERISTPNVSVVAPYDKYPNGQYAVGATPETGGSASCEVTGIVVAVDYDGDELIEVTVDYSESYESDTLLIGDKNPIPGTPLCSGDNLYAALAYINSQSASGYLSAIWPSVTDPEDVATMEEFLQGYIDSTAAYIETLIVQHEIMVAGYPSQLATQERVLAQKAYESRIKNLRRYATLNFRGQSIVLEDLNISNSSNATPNIIPHVVLNPQGGYGLCAIVNIGMPETQCPGGGQRNRNFFPSVSEGEVFYYTSSYDYGPPSVDKITQRSVVFTEGHNAVNGCIYGVSYSYGATTVGTSLHTNEYSISTTTQPIKYELRRIALLDARVKTAALAYHEHTYNTPHYMFLPHPDDGTLAQYYSQYPYASQSYSEGRIRTEIRSAYGATTANWLTWNNNELIDPADVFRRRTDGLRFPKPPTELRWTKDQQPNSAARWAIYHFVLLNPFTWSITREQDLLNERLESDESATISGYGDRVLAATFSYGDDIAISWLSGGTDPNQQTGFSPQVRMYPSSFFPKYIIEGER